MEERLICQFGHALPAALRSLPHTHHLCCLPHAMPVIRAGIGRYMRDACAPLQSGQCGGIKTRETKRPGQ
ncbi:hypothetical protein JCM25156A_29250 [Komagataeibacter kakiaceti JCM 25156]